jgi:hypothetical protein
MRTYKLPRPELRAVTNHLPCVTLSVLNRSICFRSILMTKLSIEHDHENGENSEIVWSSRSFSPMQRSKSPALGMQCRFKISREQSKIQKITCEDSRSCRQIQACATVVECNALSVFILHHIFPLDYTNCARKSRASESRHLYTVLL